MWPDTRIIAGQWTHLLRTAASSGTILPPAMRMTVCTPGPDRQEGFSHQIVHNGEVIGLARDLHYDGDIVTVTGKLNSCKAPPGRCSEQTGATVSTIATAAAASASLACAR